MITPVKAEDIYGLNTVQLAGRVLRVTDAGDSKLVALRYGPRRELNEDTSQFVNMVIFRVPNSRSEILEGINIDDAIAVVGRVSSFYLSTGEGRMTSRELETEIVAIQVRRVRPIVSAA